LGILFISINILLRIKCCGYGVAAPARTIKPKPNLGSGLIDHIQKMTMAAMAMAYVNVWAHGV
jgi:hypothetical protein